MYEFMKIVNWFLCQISIFVSGKMVSRVIIDKCIIFIYPQRILLINDLSECFVIFFQYFQIVFESEKYSIRNCSLESLSLLILQRYAVASPDSDSRCWTCHQDEPELCCISCVRSFHDSAMCCRSNRPSAEDVGPWRCPECIAIQKDKEQIRSK